MKEAERRQRRDKLDLWQRRLADADAAFSAQTAKMDNRERLYAGDRTLRPLVPGDHKKNGEWKETGAVYDALHAGDEED